MVVAYKSNFLDDEDYYKDGDTKNRKKENIEDDDFDDAIKGKLTQPTDEDDVEDAVENHPDNPVVLWRATTGPNVVAMIGFGCAAGCVRVPTSEKPTDEQRKLQIAKGASVPEFTSSTDLSFSFMHWLVVVQIQAKYLSKGSGSEGGWVCLPTAPVSVLETVDRTLGFVEDTKSANAS